MCGLLPSSVIGCFSALVLTLFYSGASVLFGGAYVIPKMLFVAFPVSVAEVVPPGFCLG